MRKRAAKSGEHRWLGAREPWGEDPVGVLVLAHGSSRSAASGEPARRVAAALNRRGEVSRAVAGFWAEPPSFEEALMRLPEGLVVVLPVFAGEGYFTQRVIPDALGLGARGEALIEGRRLICARALGAHPDMDDVLWELAVAGREALELASVETTLIVAAHGTLRHPASGERARARARSAARRVGFASVEVGFIDQPPRLDEVLEEVETPGVVVVPDFISDGPHVREDLPALARLQGGLERSGVHRHGVRVTRRGEVQRVLFTPALGTDREVQEVAWRCVSDALTERSSSIV